MISAEWILLFLGGFAFYPYAIYPAILWVVILSGLRVGRKGGGSAADSELPGISIIVAMHNEQEIAANTIDRLASAIAGIEESEILIVSDHSTDNTVAIARQSKHPGVTVIENKGGRGRSGAHNYAVKFSRFPILLFCDAETHVPINTIQSMRRAFMDPHNGCVNATIVFDAACKGTKQAVGMYWKFELWLRKVETSLGLYATSSGPCMAVRKELFVDLPPSGDVDFTTPLDVIKQGYRCVHLDNAFAYDMLPDSENAEFRARVRMVSKNFGGTVTRWGWTGVLKHPFYSWALYSHKVMRWLVPYFILAAMIDAASLAYGGNRIAGYTLGIIFLFSLLIYVGRRLPVFSQAYAFLLANLAFGIGVFKSLNGRIPSFYVPTRQGK